MNKPLREHFETPTDEGCHLRLFDYIEALENYIETIEEPKYGKHYSFPSK